MKVFVPLLLNLLLTYPGILLSDTIILKSQKSYKGKVINQDERTVTFLEDGKKEILLNKSQILKIIYKDLEDAEIKKILKDSSPSKKSKLKESGKSEEKPNSSSQNESGFKLKFGFWIGPLSLTKSHFEELNSIDTLFSNSSIHRISLDGHRKNRSYIFLPLGLSYYIPSGYGSFLLGLESRGNSFSYTTFGYSTRYNFKSLGNNSIGNHDTISKFYNLDWIFGYKFTLPGNYVSLTPKFFIRQFHEIHRDDYDWLYPSSSLLASGVKTFESKTYKSYIGLKSEFHITNAFSIFADITTTELIPLFELPTTFFLKNSAKFSEMRTYSYGIYVQDYGRMQPSVSGNRTILGLDYKWENWKFTLGFHNEVIDYKYKNISELPFLLTRSGNSFSDLKFLSNYIINFKDIHRTEIKSVFIEMEYSF